MCARPVRTLPRSVFSVSTDFSIFCSAVFLMSAIMLRLRCACSVHSTLTLNAQRPRQQCTSVPSSSPMTTRFSAPGMKIENTLSSMFWSRHSASAVASITLRFLTIASSKVRSP